MSTREWGVGYDEGYQQGWNDAMDQKPAEANEFVAELQSELDDAELEKIMLEVWQPVPLEQEPVAWMNNKDFEPIRVRIMQEAYELADRNDSEGYNAIKVMCGDVQRMLPPQRTWVGLTNEEIDKTLRVYEQDYDWISFAKAIETKLKEKNNV